MLSMITSLPPAEFPDEVREAMQDGVLPDRFDLFFRRGRWTACP
jgi:hypothetical protein